MSPAPLELAATILFGIAVLHTFSVKRLQHLALKYPQGSVGENFFHLLGEVEIVFGVWAGILIAFVAFLQGGKAAVQFVEGLNFTEPAFVFVIMTIAATRPIVRLAASFISFKTRLVPLPENVAFYVTSLVAGPLLGSFITEPAAMTVTALILRHRYFERDVSERFRYITLAALFVNVSIGGVLTNFAAPPVLMVAGIWKWGTPFMLTHFGWKAIIAVILNAIIATLLLLRELKERGGVAVHSSPPVPGAPLWLTLIHVGFLFLVVLTAHHPIFFIGVFLFFIGVTIITQEHQSELKLRESLLVAFFLGGLVILGSLQSWWLKPILAQLGEFPLFLGTTVLTAFMDNAALTYLGAQVSGITDALKYALVAGAVAGGGLTVIANAPNPAGFAILSPTFGEEGISPVSLLGYALIPTLVAMACLWWLP